MGHLRLTGISQFIPSWMSLCVPAADYDSLSQPETDSDFESDFEPPSLSRF